MKKQYTAILAALLITLCVGGAMLLVSASALLNKHGVPVADSPAAATATAEVKTAEQAQIQQLQDLVSQYQQRETQYQQQLQAAQAQMQQVQRLLLALQNRGLISIGLDGSISINR
ncbi:MAG TPA: hypothetical protein VIU39_04745 [Anaerolineales bacterium]